MLLAALSVRLVTVANDHDPLNVSVEVPSVKLRTLELLEENCPHVTACPFVSNEPFVCVSVAAPHEKASENNQEPFDVALNVVLPSVLPAVKIVCCVADVETNLISDVVALPSV